MIVVVVRCVFEKVVYSRLPTQGRQTKVGSAFI